MGKSKRAERRRGAQVAEAASLEMDGEHELEAPEPEPAPRRERAKPVKFTPTKLRIIAGDMGGRKIEYNGDPATRPMKEKTREAVFSLLGGYLDGYFAFDLFGGTGILAMEAVSRGATGGMILELSRTAVSTIVKNLKTLRIDELIEVQNVDTLRWLRSLDQNTLGCEESPWVVFVCPPYKMWQTSAQRLAEGITEIWNAAPAGSQIVCEAEFPYSFAASVPHIDWDERNYAPAVVAVARKEAPASINEFATTE